MTKKKGESAVSIFLKSFAGNFLGKFQESVQGMLALLQDKVLDTQRKIMRGIYAAFFTILGLVFALIGITLLISERMALPLSISFLMVGLIVLVLVLFYRTQE